jgi:hypothetical protein
MSLVRIIFEFYPLKEPLTNERAAQAWGKPTHKTLSGPYPNLVHEQALLTAVEQHPLGQAFWFEAAWKWMVDHTGTEIEETAHENPVRFDVAALVAELEPAAQTYYAGLALLADTVPGPLLYQVWNVVPVRILIEDGTTLLLDTSTHAAQVNRPRKIPKALAGNPTVRAVLEFTKNVAPLTPAVVDECWGPAQTQQEREERVVEVAHEQLLLDAVQAQPEVMQCLWVERALEYLYSAYEIGMTAGAVQINPSQRLVDVVYQAAVPAGFVYEQVDGLKLANPLPPVVATLPAATQAYFSETSGSSLAIETINLTLDRLVFEAGLVP